MQYRLLEFKLGNKNRDVIAVHKRDAAGYEQLERALNAPSIYDEVLRLLSRRGYGIPGRAHRARFLGAVRARRRRSRRAWLGVYHNAEKDWDLYEMAERLTDLDQKFQLWRFHHLKTVERVIGYKPGHRRHGRRVLSREGARAQVLSGAVAGAHVDVRRAVARAGAGSHHLLLRAGAPEADALIARGLHEGPGNSHPGQGTVNRRFFFRNLYLELLWVEDFDEAQAPEARRTGLWDRWINRHNGSCPLGLVFRPGSAVTPCAVSVMVVRPEIFSGGIFHRGRARHPAERAAVVLSTVRAAGAGRGRRAPARRCADRRRDRNDAASS